MSTTTTTTTDPAILSGARWFWWIAGLSLVNTVLFYSGSNMNFVVGLGLTTLANYIFAANMPLAVAIVAATIGFYVVMGLQAQRERLWAFYLGVVVYTLDALIYLRAQDWLPVAFHAFALFNIVKGIVRLRALTSAPAAAS